MTATKMAVVVIKHRPMKKSVLLLFSVSSTFVVAPITIMPEKLQIMTVHSKLDNLSFKNTVPMIPAQIGLVLSIVETNPSGNLVIENAKLR